MDRELMDLLIYLADKYETEAFLQKDPSRFMHRYTHREDQTVVAFIASSLAFGRREQILSHVESILSLAGSSPADWIAGGGWEGHFPESKQSFYRMYSYSNMRSLFKSLQEIERKGTLEGYFKRKYEEVNQGATGAWAAEKAGGYTDCPEDVPRRASPGSSMLSSKNKSEGQRLHLCQVIASCFPAECTLIPRSMDCAFKKLNMFLRWMVRDSSPVDLGLWASWFSKADLLMPLDTHVMQEATRLGLLACTPSGKARPASFKCAVELSAVMGEAFPGDPTKGDYALFGLGVDADGGK